MDDDRVITLTLTPAFASFLESVHKQHGVVLDTFNSPILALDPGETTGVAEFDGDVTIQVYQKTTKDIGQSYDWLHNLLEMGCLTDPPVNGRSPWYLRAEDYRIYEWKTKDHSWSQVHTLRWLGAIEVAAHTTGTPMSVCMAQHAKGFWTDEKLNHFGINPKGLKHGRDALRHLLYYMLFPTKEG